VKAAAAVTADRGLSKIQIECGINDGVDDVVKIDRRAGAAGARGSDGIAAPK